MDQANSISTPMISSTHLSKFRGNAIPNDSQYRSIVGALQYVTITRPEISFSVNKTSQFMQNPTDEHWKAVKRILRYLKGTINFGLTLQASSSMSITGYVDAHWGTDIDDRKSTTGYCIYLGKKSYFKVLKKTVYNF